MVLLGTTLYSALVSIYNDPWELTEVMFLSHIYQAMGYADALNEWSKVVKPKAARGVTPGDHNFKNLALLNKWWRRFGEEKAAL